MGPERIMVVCGGTIGMMLLMFLRRKLHPDVAAWKIPIISILLTISGVAGAMLMHYIESGNFSGTSFFGALLFIPIFMLPALLLVRSFNTLMDLCAPAECLMLAFLKIDCLMSDCCIGKFLPALGFQFPSQIVEMIVILIIMVVLLRIERAPGRQGQLYSWYLILYGATRFPLNLFRYGVAPFVWILPAGNFWSLIAIAGGTTWLRLVRRK